jgi:DNA-binding LacI/PurR family transcriptional regulator
MAIDRTAQPPGRVTLAEVARRAGVSRAAASYAINGKAGVGEGTRQRVLAIAEELGFRRNRLASGLRHGHSKAIGLLLADVANPFYPEIASGVLAAADALDYEVFLSHTGDDSRRQASEVYALLDHQCDGVILTTLTRADRRLLELLLRRGVPFVQLVRPPSTFSPWAIATSRSSPARRARRPAGLAPRGCNALLPTAGFSSRPTASRRARSHAKAVTAQHSAFSSAPAHRQPLPAATT